MRRFYVVLRLHPHYAVDLSRIQKKSDKRDKSDAGAKCVCMPEAGISIEVRDRIVLEHLPLVKAIAIRVHENLPVHVDLDDLIHAGVLGCSMPWSIRRVQERRVPQLRQAPYQRSHSRRPAPTRLGVARSTQAAKAGGFRHSRSLRQAGAHPTESEVAQEMESAWSGGAACSWNCGPSDWFRPRRIPTRTRSYSGIRRQAGSSARQHVPAQAVAGDAGARHRNPAERYQKVVCLYYTKEMTMKEIAG